MDKTSRTEYRRFFLIPDLPAPLTRASRHVQFFDNYIANTRMRLRSIRVPETKEWEWLMQQRKWASETDNLTCSINEITLNAEEHAQFETFEGTEIRKNRYFLEIDGRQFEFDVYLGELWGLNRASVIFRNAEDAAAFIMPAQDHVEISYDPYFRDENLVERKFDEIRDAVAKLTAEAS